MKKLLSLVLILSMILSLGLVLVSCGDDEGSEPTKEEIIAAAPDKTAEAFLNNPTLISALGILSEANGIELDLECNESLLGGLTGITLSAVTSGNATSGLVSFELLGNEYSAEIFNSGKSYAIQCASLFGSDIALLIDLGTILDTLPESALGQMMGFSEIDTTTLETLKNMLSSAEGFDYATILSEISAIVTKAVADKTITVNGAEVNCISVSYTITNTEIEALMDLIFSKLPLDAISGGADASASISSIKDELAKLNISLTTETLISYETGLLVETNGSFSIVSEQIPEANISATTKTVYGDAEITTTTSIEANGQTTTLVSSVKRSENNGKTVIESTTDLTYGDVTATLIHYSLTIDGEGNFSLSLNEGISAIITNSSSSMDAEIGISGRIIVSDNTLSVNVTSLSYEQFSVALDLSITLTKGAVVKQIPSNAKDITTLTAEEIQALMTAVQTSPLVRLFASMFPGNDSPDAYY